MTRGRSRGPLADQLDELLETIVESGRHGLQRRHYHERALRREPGLRIAGVVVTEQ